VILKQLKFIREKDLGFATHARISVPLRTASGKSAYDALRNELLKNSFVKNVSAADYLPGLYWNDIILYKPGTSMENGALHFWNDVEFDFNKILDIRLIEGRTFSDNLESEQNKIIINEASARALGFTPLQAIGQKIRQTIFKDANGALVEYEVIGVMQDFHRSSLHDQIAPALFKLTTTAPWETFNHMIVKIDEKNLSGAIADIEKIWKDKVDDTPFEYSFLDENLQSLYQEDRRQARIVAVFTVITFVVSCLGLFGLSSYLAERRVKEIGIRKVMGASVNQIMGLMSKEFLKLVLIAIGLAIPLTSYAMSQWLERFAYKTSIGPLVFLYGGLAAIVIALLTVSFQSFRAAIQDPVKALRNE
ncbi:MAG: FtsX-like permease family protein, partial [Leptolyngbya sp. SIO1D8]|nr:FtsX-like permease family protein [Leptolyngbya sp. SIO1D8]